MYFDHCESPKELGKAIGSVLTTVTFRRLDCAGPGPHTTTLVGPLEEQTLREALLEARRLVEKFRKGNPELRSVPDMLCYPLEGLLRVSAWCDEAERVEETALSGVKVAPEKPEPRPNAQQQTGGTTPADRKRETIVKKAHRIHRLVQNDRVRERFREQCRAFYDRLKTWQQVNDDYEAAIASPNGRLYESTSKERKCIARMEALQKKGLQTSAEYEELKKTRTRLAEEKRVAGEESEKAKVSIQEPGPCPVDWLGLPGGGQSRHNRVLVEYFFPDSVPAATKESERLRAYILTTILHDKALKGTCALISEGIWPLNEDFVQTQWNEMEADWFSWHDEIDAAIDFVKTDLVKPKSKPNGQGQRGETARGGDRIKPREDEIHYSPQEGFTGITDRNKAIWAKRYPHISDFDREVKEIEEHLRQNPTEAEKAAIRPRLYLDHYFSPESEWTPIGMQTAPQMPPESFAELADRIEMKLDLDRTLSLDGKGFSVTQQEYLNFRFDADRLRKVDSDARALPGQTGDPTVDTVCLMEYCQEEAKRQLSVARGVEGTEKQEGSKEHPIEQRQPLDVPSLVDRLKTLRSALDGRDGELISRARSDLKAYVGSAEQLYDALQEPLRGSTADAIERLRWVGDARKSRVNTGLYAGVLDALATPEFIAELERWQAPMTKSLPSLPQTSQEKIQPSDCTHSDDFSSVLWYGTSHHFTATQASCVALLWAEWEKDPQAGLGLREKFIGEKIGSSNENYRLAHTFRQKGKRHPAWGTMIHAKGDGFFYLAEPAAVKKPSKKHKK